MLDEYWIQTLREWFSLKTFEVGDLGFSICAACGASILVLEAELPRITHVLWHKTRGEKPRNKPLGFPDLRRWEMKNSQSKGF